jgi:hypothetical protein
MFQTNKKYLKYLFLIFFNITIVMSIFAEIEVSEIIFKDSFETMNLKNVWCRPNRSHSPDTLVKISDKAAFNGKKAVLLYDNDPKQTVRFDYVGKLPRSGVISGYLMFPKYFKGHANYELAYTSIRLIGSKRNPLIIISIRASSQEAVVNIFKDGKLVKVAVLPHIVSFDTWVPWRIAWQWDGKSLKGVCRITIANKETDTFAYSAGKFTCLRLLSGWSSALNNSVYYDFIRIKSGGVFTGSLVKQERGTFAVKKVKTVFTDTFSKINNTLPAGWIHWQIPSDSGKAVYERSLGRNDSGSLCFIDSMRCWWQRKLPVTPGKTYRLSGWIKVEQASAGKVGLHIIPVIVFKETGKRALLARDSSVNGGKLLPGAWNYFEVFWTAPASGEYPEGKLVGIDIAFWSSGLTGKAWCDDIVLDEVVMEKPFCDSFSEKDNSLKNWQIWSPSGLEGHAEVLYELQGYADNGAIAVKHLKGKTGLFAAAKILERKIFGGEAQWTLLAHAEATGQGKPSLSIQQLDVNDKIIQETNGDTQIKKITGWAEYELTFSILPRTKKLKLLLVNGGKDIAVFDNVWLRPATVDEKTVLAGKKKYPVWMNIFPADSFAVIDNKPAVMNVLSGQTTAFCIKLAGDDKPGKTTIVDLDMPDWLTLRTVQMAIYGKAPLQYEKIKPSAKGRVTYRFKNPYNWQQIMTGGNPNPWTGMLIAVRPNAAAGTKDRIVIRTQLGKVRGEERRIMLAVEKAMTPAPGLKKFHVGLYTAAWLNLRDDIVRRELYQTYVNAGIKYGATHPTHKFAFDTMKEFGFIPLINAYSPESILPYRNQSSPDKAILASGKISSSHIALGLALNDPETRQKYKKYLAGCLKALPDRPSYVVADIEFWGETATAGACFHPSTIAAFRKYAGISDSVKLTSAIILKQYYRQWSDFRNWVTAELYGVIRKSIQDIRPDIKLMAYDYTLQLNGKPQAFIINAPMNTLLYDSYVDVHLISYYNYEGTQFLDHIDNDVKCLKKPVWAIPYIVDAFSTITKPNWGYHHPSAKEICLEIVGTAASGAEGFMAFDARLLSVDRLMAIAKGVSAVAKYESFYMDGKRADRKVTLVNPDGNIRYRVHELKGKLLLTLFNCADRDLKVSFKFAGKQQDVLVNAHNFKQIIFN